jgi:hypothetical protein
MLTTELGGNIRRPSESEKKVGRISGKFCLRGFTNKFEPLAAVSLLRNSSSERWDDGWVAVLKIVLLVKVVVGQN